MGCAEWRRGNPDLISIRRFLLENGPGQVLPALFFYAAFLARYAAQRFFEASEIRFRAAALIVRFPADTALLLADASLGMARPPSCRCISPILSTISNRCCS